MRYQLAFIFTLLTWWFVTTAYTCQSGGVSAQSSVTTTTSVFRSYHDLRSQSWQVEQWVIVYDEQLSDSLVSALQDFVQRPLRTDRQGPKLVALSQNEYQTNSLRQSPVIWLCTSLPPIIKERLNELPSIEYEGEHLTLGTETINQEKDLLRLNFLPSPWNDTLGMHLIWSPDIEVLGQYLQEQISKDPFQLLYSWPSWGYQHWRKGQRRCMGNFNDSTWQMDKVAHFEFSADQQALALDSVVHLHIHDNANTLNDQLLARLSKTQQEIMAFTGVKALPPLEISTYPTVERKALQTGNMDVVHLDGDHIHWVNNAYFNGADWGQHLRPWLRMGLGKAEMPILEAGLTLQWVTQIHGQPWRAWAHALATANTLASPELLFDEQRQVRELPLIGLITAAAWQDYLLQIEGKDALLAFYHGETPPPNEQQFAACKSFILKYYPPLSSTTKVAPLQRLNGFTLAHEGYSIYNGYGSERARQSIIALSHLGVDALAIVPYSYLQNPNRPDPIPVTGSAGSENDEATLFSHFAAQEQGQYTLLKPQIWLGGGSWPGDVDFETNEEWATFFLHYRHWIMHYALLAEMYGVDALCIGTELRYTTLKQPERWRDLIRDIRQVYSGTLTYAANWGEECEQLSFWDELDFIGVNAYYPLSKKENPSEEDLTAGAHSMLIKIGKIADRYDRPIWLTEIGYRSSEKPWISPHADPVSDRIDNEAQARCYQAVFSAVADYDWLKGFFWWKWPSDLSHNEYNGKGYMPLNKPTARILQQNYHHEE